MPTNAQYMLAQGRRDFVPCDLKGAQRLWVVCECCSHTRLCVSLLKIVALSDVEALGLVADKMFLPEREVSDEGN